MGGARRRAAALATPACHTVGMASGTPEGGKSDAEYQASQEFSKELGRPLEAEGPVKEFADTAARDAAGRLESAREMGGKVVGELGEFAKPYIKEGRNLAIDAGREAYWAGDTYLEYVKGVASTPVELAKGWLNVGKEAGKMALMREKPGAALSKIDDQLERMPGTNFIYGVGKNVYEQSKGLYELGTNAKRALGMDYGAYALGVDRAQSMADSRRELGETARGIKEFARHPIDGAKAMLGRRYEAYRKAVTEEGPGGKIGQRVGSELSTEYMTFVDVATGVHELPATIGKLRRAGGLAREVVAGRTPLREALGVKRVGWGATAERDTEEIAEAARRKELAAKPFEQLNQEGRIERIHDIVRDAGEKEVPVDSGAGYEVVKLHPESPARGIRAAQEEVGKALVTRPEEASGVIAERMPLLKQEYKIHLQPKPEATGRVLAELAKAAAEDPELRDALEAYKVSKTAKTAEGSGVVRLGPRMREGGLPEIVIYPKLGRENFDKALGKLRERFAGMEELGSGVKPRYNERVNDLIYAAQSGGDLKTSLRDAGKLDEYFDAESGYSRLKGERSLAEGVAPETVRAPERPATAAELEETGEFRREDLLGETATERQELLEKSRNAVDQAELIVKESTPEFLEASKSELALIEAGSDYQHETALEIEHLQAPEGIKIPVEKGRKLVDSAEIAEMDNPFEAMVAVRMTDAIPVIENGQVKVLTAMAATKGEYPRASSHWALNRKVESHSKGNWDTRRLAIVSPMDGMVRENGVPLALDQLDTYWAVPESVKLPEGTTILYHRDAATDPRLIELQKICKEQKVGVVFQEVDDLSVERVNGRIQEMGYGALGGGDVELKVAKKFDIRLKGYQSHFDIGLQDFEHSLMASDPNKLEYVSEPPLLFRSLASLEKGKILPREVAQQYEQLLDGRMERLMNDRELSKKFFGKVTGDLRDVPRDQEARFYQILTEHVLRNGQESLTEFQQKYPKTSKRFIEKIGSDEFTINAEAIDSADFQLIKRLDQLDAETRGAVIDRISERGGAEALALMEFQEKNLSSAEKSKIAEGTLARMPKFLTSREVQDFDSFMTRLHTPEARAFFDRNFGRKFYDYFWKDRPI